MAGDVVAQASNVFLIGLRHDDAPYSDAQIRTAVNSVGLTDISGATIDTANRPWVTATLSPKYVSTDETHPCSSARTTSASFTRR